MGSSEANCMGDKLQGSVLTSHSAWSRRDISNTFSLSRRTATNKLDNLSWLSLRCSIPWELAGIFRKQRGAWRTIPVPSAA